LIEKIFTKFTKSFNVIKLVACIVPLKEDSYVPTLYVRCT
jgi:hypothetical protein